MKNIFNDPEYAELFKRPTKWYLVLMLFLAIGLFDSIYLAYHHYKVNILKPETASFCVINETIDCDRVTTSFGATVMGVSVATLGMFAHAFLFFFIYIENFLKFGEKEHLYCFVYVIALLMALFALYELFISFVILKAVCIMCVVLYVTTAMTLISCKRGLALKHSEIIKILTNFFFPTLHKPILKRMSTTLIASFVLSAIVSFGLDYKFVKYFERLKIDSYF